MPSILNATTTSGLVTSADNSGELQLQTNNGTTAVTVTTGQNVGIGTSSPTQRLDVAGNITGNDYIIRQTAGTIGYTGANGAGIEIYGSSSGTPNIVTVRTSNAERMRITSGGEVFVGTTSTFDSSYKFNLFVDTANGFITRPNTNKSYNGFSFRNSSNSEVGFIFCTNTATSYGTSSDYRLKENIAPMTGALDKVAQLKPVTYKWKADGSDGQGFIAHELAEVCPDAVVGEKDAVDEEGNPKYQGVDTSFLVATLTAAIQELKAELDATKAEVQALKGVA